MDPTAQAVPGYYVWQLPEKPVVVHLNLDIIDRLLAEVMRGFGAVPKRGAEVGGLLLGSVEQGHPTVLRVEDFEVVPCEYRRGPSYLLTEDDGSVFDDACRRGQTAGAAYAVGYFRSNTRDGLSLSSEDVSLMEQYFPVPSNVALLIKPFATKVSTASFFFREGGQFPSAAPLEFPFRRRELTGEEGPPRRSMLERVPRRAQARSEVESIAAAVPTPGPAAPARSNAYPPASKQGWVWLPLSLVFLLLGMALGFLISSSMAPKTVAGADYSLGLTITKDGENLSVKWDRDAAAVRAAQKGVLEIEDGKYSKPVDLDAAQLRNGSILFTNSSKTVRFRLIVYPQARVTVMQTMEWKGEEALKKESGDRSQ